MESNDYMGVYKMTITAKKWGNSIGIRIPSKLANKYGVTDGTQMDIHETKNGIMLKPHHRPTLDDLLSQCEGENPNEEFFANPKGKEEI